MQNVYVLWLKKKQIRKTLFGMKSAFLIGYSTVISAHYQVFLSPLNFHLSLDWLNQKFVPIAWKYCRARTTIKASKYFLIFLIDKLAWLILAYLDISDLSLRYVTVIKLRRVSFIVEVTPPYSSIIVSNRRIYII